MKKNLKKPVFINVSESEIIGSKVEAVIAGLIGLGVLIIVILIMAISTGVQFVPPP